MTKTIFRKKLLILTTIAVLATGLTLATTLDYAEAKKDEAEIGNPVADAIDRLGLTIQGLPGLPGPSGEDGSDGAVGDDGSSCSIDGTIVSCTDGTSNDVQGPPGDDGTSGTLVTTIRQDSKTIGGAIQTITVGCDPGEVITGGGYNTDSPTTRFFKNQPIPGNSWQVSAVDLGSGTSGTVTAYAVCAKLI